MKFFKIDRLYFRYNHKNILKATTKKRSSKIEYGLVRLASVVGIIFPFFPEGFIKILLNDSNVKILIGLLAAIKWNVI
ncbi:hypothetical protein BpHYR1_017595 [Brachionus plicatilis]|uniref:Uncharacterized protein n=1 Tax=Brachionus plicatilis TaxID=10195 RepID=A0A3M7SDG9_BRAPC|nr:hypothetical protein BpHYR1_017595 [Brachionus plicatilis]